MKNILALIRFSHTLFALPFALLGMLMAYRMPPLVTFHWRPILGILLCMVAARSAAMAFNRLLDRKIDAANPRTAGRHLPQGILRVGTVALFTLLCAVGFVASTLLFLPNRLPLYFALPVLAFLLAYSWTKRFTWLSHLWLGTALALSPWGAWVAIRGEIWALPPILLAAAVACWVTGFDIIYACQDYDFDKQSGLRSIPSRFGLRNALRIAAVAHFTMLGFLLAVGVL